MQSGDQRMSFATFVREVLASDPESEKKYKYYLNLQGNDDGIISNVSIVYALFVSCYL